MGTGAARTTPVVLAAILLAHPAAASDGGWSRSTVQAAGRLLAVSRPAEQRPGETLTIVIEGDGAAFDSRGRPTNDPTSAKEVGLELAKAWPTGPVVWAGRLCQHVRSQDPLCDPRDWSEARYSETAVAAINAVVEAEKQRLGATRVNLVGWSGGGVMAMLVAQARTDVAGVATFAAPLDLEAWSRRHGMAPLEGSVDPSKGRFSGPPPKQVHMFGAFDAVTPPPVALEAARRMAAGRGLVAIRPERHDCCWARRVEEAAAALAE